MKYIPNEKGLTLVEVLISIVILSIILLSFMRFFPQMGYLNKQNEDKTQAINSAKEILIDWQNSNDVKDFLNDPALGNLPGYTSEDSSYYYCETTKGSFKVKIKIKKTSDLNSVPTEARFIQVQLLNNSGSIVSETYGYIRLE
jgi:prepilin-type N-terminal cleavage/methylation domain-containing protein